MLWVGETANKYGSAVTGLALPLVAVSTLHASTLQVGLLGAAGWLPWLLIGLPAGVWVDRLRCRPIMLASTAVSLLLYATVPLAALAGALTLWHLLAVALLAGAAGVFFQTAYTAYLPQLLEPADQSEGNAKLHGSASAAGIAGLGSGGLIAQLAGPVNGLLANTATFLLSLWCTARIGHREPGRGGRPRRALRREIGEGLRLLASDVWFRTFALFGAASNLVLTGYQSLLVVFLIREVGVGEGTVGLLVAAASTGGIVGAAVARRIAARIGTARAMLVLELALPALTVLIPLTDRGAGLVWYLVGGFGASCGVVAGNVIKATFQQRYCPPELLGRLSASSAVLNFGSIPLGALLAGVLGTQLGVRPAMWLMTAGVPLAALILWCSPMRRVRDLPTERRVPVRETGAGAGAGAGAAGAGVAGAGTETGVAGAGTARGQEPGGGAGRERR
ncbi:MFS transporter [Kitasatospora sp. NA04385]|uniref:MFS transporter n=1 Tax=Kitasatospora sp. NA04385 TaxID=2742135 RepID=UPI0020CB46D4|nr:MFS transporter [Kitasatospora sp. NA04385]